MFTRKNQPETTPETASTNAGKGFMAELDEWLDIAVFEPIENAIEPATPKSCISPSQRANCS